VGDGAGDGAAESLGAGAALGASTTATGSAGIRSAAIVRANCATKSSAKKPMKAFLSRALRSPYIMEKNNFSDSLCVFQVCNNRWNMGQSSRDLVELTTVLEKI
jgi:hypothetical protein